MLTQNKPFANVAHAHSNQNWISHTLCTHTHHSVDGTLTTSFHSIRFRPMPRCFYKHFPFFILFEYNLTSFDLLYISSPMYMHVHTFCAKSSLPSPFSIRSFFVSLALSVTRWMSAKEWWLKYEMDFCFPHHFVKIHCSLIDDPINVGRSIKSFQNFWLKFKIINIELLAFIQPLSLLSHWKHGIAYDISVIILMYMRAYIHDNNFI